MRSSRTTTVALGTMALALVAGCSMRSLEKRSDKITGRDKKEDRVDLNSAGRNRLAKLPGLTGDDADRIVANRPYERRRDLVRKGVLTEQKFDRIRDEVYVDHGKD